MTGKTSYISYLAHGDTLEIKFDSCSITEDNCMGNIDIAGQTTRFCFTKVNGLLKGDLTGKMKIVIKYEKIDDTVDVSMTSKTAKD